jgi:hypothetical protein
MPPARPATTGVRFQSDSDTTRPKPSRIDFCTITSERRWKRVDLYVADPGEVREQGDALIVRGCSVDAAEAPEPRAVGSVSSARSTLISGVRVRDVMSRKRYSAPSDVSVAALLDQYLFRYRFSSFLC